MIDLPNKLSEDISNSASTGIPVDGELKTDDRIIARVTDGIYREPWSAFRELVSNAYDADATNVSIDCDYPFFKEIRIADNGLGMDPAIFEHLLLHIGGSSKRTARGKELGTASLDDATLSPSGRRLIGKIGIGLFAVAQLTQQFQIISKRKGDTKRISATIQLKTFQEDTLADAPEAESISGSYKVLAEETGETETHGTTIILTSIRPAIRQKLQSSDVWSAIDEISNDPETGLLDLVAQPKFHIGRVNQELELVDSPELPWSSDDAPLTKFQKLFDAAINVSRSAREQANLSHFDNYLKMLWRLSLACPVEYLQEHPFDIDPEGKLGVFELSNSPKGSASETILEEGITPRKRFDLVAGSADPIGEFTVHIDGVELRRPIVLPMELNAASQIGKPLLFIGKVNTNFGGSSPDRSGGELGFEAYLYWNSKIVPKESVGALIRVNGASGTLFDPEFMGYQVSEQTRKRQVTAEIFVNKGLDGALNIDRESFNTSHPHYLYIQKWLHSAFRQFATQHKKIGAAVRKERAEEKKEVASSKMQQHADQVWSKMRGETIDPPAVEFQDSGTGISIPKMVGANPIIWTAEKTTSKHVENTQLIEAISVVLEAHGVLEGLDEKGRAELIFDLISVFEPD
ncbi:ATP-binding protein [Ruegeria sp. HKCCE3926]|uniref:ATP-binding protein n=1 Tax=Ruegeria sp. HKCCE3926 TaxID=2794831 RepID=UPI001AE838A7|nr:ATP-binding protein [Ruegeria sp. HKCCE3926]